MEKINFQNGVTKLNKETMDTFQSNIETAIEERGSCSKCNRTDD